MVTQLQPIEILDSIQNEQFTSAQTVWWTSKTLQLAGLILSIIIVISDASWIGFLIVILAIASAIAEWRFAHLWELAQSLHRKHEFWDSLGWALSGRELSDLHATMPQKLRARLEAVGYEETTYFASGTPVSPRRLVENLMESSWWTWHLAKYHWKIITTVFVVVLILAIGILLTMLEAGFDVNTGQTASRIIATILAFLITGGYLRLSVEYYDLYREAEHVERKTESILKQDDIELDEAIALYTDYQFFRVSSPPILTRLWKHKRDTYNESWSQHRQNL